MSLPLFWLTLSIGMSAVAFGIWGLFDARSYSIFSEHASASAVVVLLLGLWGLHSCWSESPLKRGKAEK